MRSSRRLFLVAAAFAHTPPEELNFTAAIGSCARYLAHSRSTSSQTPKTHLGEAPRIDSIDALNARRDQVRRQILQNVGGLPGAHTAQCQSGGRVGA